jgi:hypothetical protein
MTPSGEKKPLEGNEVRHQYLSYMCKFLTFRHISV